MVRVLDIFLLQLIGRAFNIAMYSLITYRIKQPLKFYRLKYVGDLNFRSEKTPLGPPKMC